MRLIYRVADKPIQFPRGHRGSQVRLIAAAHLKGSPGPPCWGDRAAYEAISQTRCRLVERKDIFPREGRDTSDIVVAANCIAPRPRGN